MATAVTTMSQQGEITLDQLSNHDSLDSLWIAVNGHVYDLTSFSSDHPGGIEALETSAGTDGTEAYEYAGHSESNMAKMQQYRIGRLAGSIEQPAALAHESLVKGKKQMKKATYGLSQMSMPRWLKAITALVTSLIAFSLIYWHILSTLELAKLRFGGDTENNMGYAFFAGIISASFISMLGFRYLYKLFMSSLDYENDVFNFPPVIPRKKRC